MKTPAVFRQHRAELGALLLKRTVTEPAAAGRLAATAMKDQPFLRAIVAEYALTSLRAWVSRHRGAGEDDGQLALSFPDLPRQLEVAPGRFVEQGAMTRRDWTAAVVQARTKAANAVGHAERVEAAAAKVLPLLVDDELTTAQVLRRAA